MSLNPVSNPVDNKSSVSTNTAATDATTKDTIATTDTAATTKDTVVNKNPPEESFISEYKAPIIVGGVVGGLVLILIIAFVIYKLSKG